MADKYARKAKVKLLNVTKEELESQRISIQEHAKNCCDPDNCQDNGRLDEINFLLGEDV